MGANASTSARGGSTGPLDHYQGKTTLSLSLQLHSHPSCSILTVLGIDQSASSIEIKKAYVIPPNFPLPLLVSFAHRLQEERVETVSVH